MHSGGSILGVGLVVLASSVYGQQNSLLPPGACPVVSSYSATDDMGDYKVEGKDASTPETLKPGEFCCNNTKGRPSCLACSCVIEGATCFPARCYRGDKDGNVQGDLKCKKGKMNLNAVTCPEPKGCKGSGFDNWGQCGIPWWFWIIVITPFVAAGIFFFKYKDMLLEKKEQKKPADSASTVTRYQSADKAAE